LKIVLLSLCLFIYPLFIVEAAEKTRILWLTDDSSDQKNHLEGNQVSIGTDTTNLVLNSLDNYQLDFLLAQIPRINLLLKSNDNICVGNRVKTNERALYNVFSLPLNIYPGLRLYYVKKYSNIPPSLLNESLAIKSLPTLFDEQPNNILGISKGRSFGKYLDEQVNKISKKNIMVRAGNGRYEALSQMLIKNRIDYMIDFPTEHKRKMDLAASKYSSATLPEIKSVAIANSPPFIFGRIACTNTAIGRKFIAEVDKILLTLYQDASFYQAHARYINESDLPAFKLAFKEYFQQFVH